MHAVWLMLTFIVPSLLVLGAGVVIGINVGYDRGYHEGFRAGQIRRDSRRPIRLETSRPNRISEVTR